MYRHHIPIKAGHSKAVGLKLGVHHPCLQPFTKEPVQYAMHEAFFFFLLIGGFPAIYRKHQIPESRLSLVLVTISFVFGSRARNDESGMPSFCHEVYDLCILLCCMFVLRGLSGLSDKDRVREDRRSSIQSREEEIPLPSRLGIEKVVKQDISNVNSDKNGRVCEAKSV